MNKIQIAVLASLFATTAPAVASAEEAPTPSKQAKDLKRLIGRWEGKGSMKIGTDKPFDVAATYECRDASGGFGLACHFTMTGIPGLASYELDDVWGYDPGDGLIHWFTVTNAGETHDHKGKIDGQTLTARFTGKRDGAKFVEDVTMTFVNTTRMRARSVGKLGGKVLEDLSIDMTKTAGKAK